MGYDARPRRGLPVPRLVFAGRLHEEKGPDVLLEALAAEPSLPVCFVLGSGRLESALQRRAAEADLRGRVRLCGWRRDPAQWIAGATAVIVPSREEAWSQTAVLGMALGVPVVGTDVEGLADTLADGRGVAVAPGDAGALAAALLAVVAGERRTDLDGAREWARRFELERVADVYETAYRTLLAGSSDARPVEAAPA